MSKSQKAQTTAPQIMTLDMKDKRILCELDRNARQTYSEIGKKVRLSKQVVEYRINQLKKNDVLQGFYPVIHSQLLGFIYCRVSITLQNISPQQLRAMENDIIAHKYVFWFFDTQGPFDLFFGLWTRSLSEFEQQYEEFMGKYSKFVKTATLNIATDVIYLPHRYLLDAKHMNQIHVNDCEKRVTIDAKDYAILQMLCEDARRSLVDIGTLTKLHPKVVAYRIAQMEHNGLILGYKPIINYDQLGFTYYKLFINLHGYTQEQLRSIKEWIKQHPATIYLVEGIALHADIDCELIVRSNHELSAFITALRERFPAIISDFSTVIFMRALKTRFLPEMKFAGKPKVSRK